MRLDALLLCVVVSLPACSGSISAPPPPEAAGVGVAEKSEPEPGSKLLPWLVLVGTAAASFFGVLAIVSSHGFESGSG